MQKLINWFGDYKVTIAFLACIIIFLLLLFKDPFSERTLIPNFEPYPDTFHYIVPALSLLKGEGFYITREGRSMKTAVAPLYSIVLLPIFFINSDPRFFYFTNIILALSSVTLFFLIIKKLTENIWIVSFVSFLYITNYFIYWYPTLAMAENLILTLFLSGVWLLLNKLSRVNAILAGFLVISFYATKTAEGPLTATFLLSYILKIVFESVNSRERIRMFPPFLWGFILSLSLYLLYEITYTKSTVFNSFLSYVPLVSPVASDTTNPTPWFSLSYVGINLPLYLNALIGKSMRFLWDGTPIVPNYVGILGLMGLFSSLFFKRFYLLGFSLLIMLFGSIIFISTFYSADARYIYHAISTLLIGFALFGSFLLKFLKRKRLRPLFYTILVGLFIFYAGTNAIRIKNQIMLNLKYAETPWYYISVLKMNEYFTEDKITDGKKPVVISPMPPYLVDFFSTGNYTLLPLDQDQEFRGAKEIVWGPNDYSDLPRLYTKYLNEGYPLFVARYGLGNEGYLNASFRNLVEKFKLTLVQEGCYSQCNIYKVDLP